MKLSGLILTFAVLGAQSAFASENYVISFKCESNDGIYYVYGNRDAGQEDAFTATRLINDTQWRILGSFSKGKAVVYDVQRNKLSDTLFRVKVSTRWWSERGQGIYQNEEGQYRFEFGPSSGRDQLRWDYKANLEVAKTGQTLSCGPVGIDEAGGLSAPRGIPAIIQR